MVGAKYAPVARLIWTSWILLFTVTETIHTSKTLKWSWNWLKTKQSYLNEYIYCVTLTCFLGCALYWMKQLSLIKVNFIKKECYLSCEHFSTLLQSEIEIFSQLHTKKSISKRALLLGRDNFLTHSGPKNFARWRNWLWRLVLGLSISLLQSIQTTCNITRCCWSSSITDR